MIDKIKKALEKEKIDYWEISQIDVERSNIYFELDEQESYLSGKGRDVFITVYKKFGNSLGEASVSIKEDDDIKKKVREAVLAASLVKNPFYVPFAKHGVCPKSGCSGILGYDEIRKKALEAYEEMRNKKEKLNALEIFTKKTKFAIINNFGEELVQEKSGAYVEAVITSKGSRGEQEYVPMRSEGTLANINMKEFIDKYSETAREISNSTKPSMFKGSVILSGDAIAEFFVPTINENPLVIHSAARMKYLKISRFEAGKQIVPEIIGDKITIISNPLVRDGLRSSDFDDAFVPAKKIALIENGIMKNFFASKRYADYLKIEPTGPLGNIEVLPGETAENEMRKDGVCEIAGFSSFAPNVYSGDFTAEIRLGYLYKKGKRISFRGGMLVGNCIDLMKNIKLSKETFFKSGYYGPKAIMFGKAVVSGV